MVKNYGNKSTTPVNRLSARNRRRVGIDITRRLPFELQIAIQRAAGRAVHRARQSLVNAQIRRGARVGFRLRSAFLPRRVSRVRVVGPRRLGVSSNVKKFYRKK